LVADASGNVYVVGKTMGKLGQQYYGKSDGFIFKVDSTARLLWSLQIGSKEDDELKHADVDASGNLYVTGYICPDDVSRPKDIDVLVIKVDGNGKTVWKKTFGTDSPDVGENIVVDKDGSLYITGSTKGIMTGRSFGQEDFFILHLDSSGNVIHKFQFGTPKYDQCSGITIGEDDKVLVCGTTEGSLAVPNSGGSDMFWGVFTKDLKQIKIVQSGTNKGDYAGEIKTDAIGNVYWSRHLP